ncbi:MAG: hypothetical protein IKV94_05915 [Clostridia bacterium]|nr:hypothetical protein [Clostridia bacterium]
MGIVIIIIIIFAFCMKKFKCDLKGFELLGFWAIHYICNEFDIVGIPTFLLCLFYVIRLIITKKYIRWYLIVIQAVCSILALIHLGNYEDKVCHGMCFGALANFLIYLVIIGHMIIINVITLIIRLKRKNKEETIKERKTLSKEKTRLYKVFVVFSIIILIGLFPFVGSLMDNFPDAYPENEASSGNITTEIANQIAIFVWPILIAYIVMFIIMIIKKTNYRRVYYPLAVVTIEIILLDLSIIYSGYMVMWFVVILFWPCLVGLILSWIIGYKVDKQDISMTLVSIMWTIIIALAIVPCFAFVTFDTDTESNTNMNDNINNGNQEQVQQNNENYIKTRENEIKQEFDSLLNNKFVKVKEIKIDTNKTSISNITLLIVSNNLPSSETEFCKKIIEEYSKIKHLLNKYNYAYQTIHFEFTGENLYAAKTSEHYKEGGYIRDMGNVYHIYLNPAPIEIVI